MAHDDEVNRGHGRVFRPHPAVYASLAMLLACVAGVFAWIHLHTYAWDEETVGESMKRGDRIVEAIERFERAKQRLPVTLDELEPEFTQDVASPTAGDRVWEYYSWKAGVEPAGFALSFHAGADHDFSAGMCYTRKRGWEEFGKD